MVKNILSILLVLVTIVASAQEKVGVVLSGGGAKGLYHVGILKALEENNIPVDYISGTSMGAIIAGLYAAGYTPEEIEEICVSPQIATWVSGKMDSQYSYYYSKMEDRPTMLNFNFDVDKILTDFKLKKSKKSDDKIVEGLNSEFETGSKSVKVYYNKDDKHALPSNLVSSMQLDVGLMSYFAGANYVAAGDFDSLYIPFRCVSVDAVTSTERFWDKGDLSVAIRSSMAIPVVFSPVIIDSTVMFDGGVYNNFPWKDSQKEWQPDFMIGGRCVAGDVLDVSSATGQMMALIVRPTDYNLPDSLGLMIGRAVPVGTLDFGRAKEIIDMGYKDAMEQMPEILKRTPRFVTKEERDAKRNNFREKIPPLLFNKLDVMAELKSEYTYDTTTVKGYKKYERDSLRYAKKLDRIEKHLESDTLNLDEFKHTYFRVFDDGSAKASFPYTNFVDSLGVYDLDVDINRDPLVVLRGGVNISSSSINQLYLGATYRRSKNITSFYSLDGYLGSFYGSVQASSRYNFYNQDRKFYLYNTFTFNKLNFRQANNQRYSYGYDFMSKEDKMSEFYLSSTLGTSAGRKSKFEIRAAGGVDIFTYSAYDLDVDAYEVNLRSKVAFATLNAKLELRTLDDIFFPTIGTSQKVSVMGAYLSERVKYNVIEEGEQDYGTGDLNSFIASAKFTRTQYLNIAKWMTLGYFVEGVIAVNPQLSSVSNSYMLPRFAPTLYTKTIFIPEFMQSYYVALGLMPVVKPFKNFEIRPEVYGFMSDLEDATNIRYVFAATMVYKLPIASISFTYNRLGVESVKQDVFMFNLNAMLFNPRGVVY